MGMHERGVGVCSEVRVMLAPPTLTGGPCRPVSPVAPVSPLTPAEPVGPGGPGRPGGPRLP